MTDGFKNNSQDITKTISETSIKNNEVLVNLNGKTLNLKSGKGMIAPFLTSSLVNLFKPENKGQFRLKKEPISTRMNDFYKMEENRLVYIPIC